MPDDPGLLRLTCHSTELNRIEKELPFGCGGDGDGVCVFVCVYTYYGRQSVVVGGVEEQDLELRCCSVWTRHGNGALSTRGWQGAATGPGLG